MNITAKNFMRFKKDPLYKTSFLIILTSILNSFIGFLFWIFASRLYSTEYIGLNTAIISLMFIIVYISSFGFDQSIIRFFPNRNNSNVFSTAITISASFSVLIGIIFILSISFWSPSLIILQEHPLLFIAFVLANSITFLASNSFIALRKAQYYLYQTIVIGSRLLFLFSFIFLGEFGILYSIGTSLIIATMFSTYFLFKVDIRFKKIDINFLKESFRFSMGNYFAGIFNMIPTYVLPVIVLNILGAVDAAYYYISFAIFSVLSFIPNAFSTSLFVEGSHGKSLNETAIKSFKLTVIILIPLIILIFLYGDVMLSIFGKDYLEGFTLLKILSISSFFVAIYQTYISIKKVQKDIKSLIIISSMNSALIIFLSYLLMMIFGINGIGYSWLISYGIFALLILIKIKRKK
ncbi:polysaccharide biosynthesis C-terminal domain-containing protein [Methanobacterium oryzae]|uniref:oligosaccharide flippase family protein n=1 Tax=Methanobacterium oryzae TaxID=69540 RepID=UPI003D1E606A